MGKFDDDTGLERVEDAMAPWQCPWCGEEWDSIQNKVPDYGRSVQAFDRWLEEHTLECLAYQKEVGQ